MGELGATGNTGNRHLEPRALCLRQQKPGAPQQSALFRREWVAAVNCRSIVVNDQIAESPLVAVNRLRPRRIAMDFLKQGCALFCVHTIHMQSMIRADIQGLAIQIGMRPNERM